MNYDIVASLRLSARWIKDLEHESWFETADVQNDAADEIERLQADLLMKNRRIGELADHIEELQEEINDLRLQVVTLSIPKEFAVADMNRFAADAVLDMPEIKTVADVLYRLANGERKMDHGRRQLEIWGVPDLFISWMLRETPKAGSDDR